MKSWKWRPALPAAVLAAAMTVSGCGDGDARPDIARPRLENGQIVFPEGSPQVASFATDAVRESGPLRLRLTGRLVWDENRTVRLYPPFAGRVLQILVKTGERVSRGQALARLASPDFGQAQADARRAQSDFALAEKNLARLRELHAAGVSSRKDLATAEADYARADAELARAMGKVKLYGASADSVDQNFSLASPIDGVVVERNINPGQELRPDLQLANTPAMFVITDPGRLWVQLDAAESQLAALKVGKKIELRSAAWPDEIFAATIENVSDFIDPQSRVVKVRGAVVNRERKLKGEMFVTADLEESPGADLRVPEKALVLAGDSYYVFVEEKPGRYSRQEVKIDAVREGTASVASGLKLGQKIVVEGNLFLHRLHRQLSGGAPA
ncbi:MAG TPA: efflux RND transporter periplasmic adaptor subunit [Burkholderiales bacterium]|nr:efflux RND transporter periplasmic adaptor subunit [Burkholderiales bacterium]HYA46349.1 efflux RND transporter periplasmic adaptor subunit [Burkholderiales bacterium]